MTEDPVILMDTRGRKGTKTHNTTNKPYFDESYVIISEQDQVQLVSTLATDYQ